MIFVHNSSTTPLTQIEGISLPASNEVDIVINQLIYKKYEPPYSDCFDEANVNYEKHSLLLKETVEQTKFYKQKYCLQLW